MASSASPAPPGRVSFASLTHQNIGTVRKLNSVLFPVKYSDKYYQDILQTEVEPFCQLIYYNDVPIGNICCRLENKELYLTTLGVLAPYRSRKLGSQALQRIIEAASLHNKPQIKRISLHVQVSNGDAKRFYESHGFGEAGIHKNYYKKITPQDAWILEKIIEHGPGQ
ncbi:N-acetyltransferase NAT13 [Boletus edulis]|uniref:N-acetyltransferase NAT13 n=1 Tax=Boletus edulis BED1 TaxID=1328754 RepID=A0AAD4GGL3_BOLED|nr:N-acetyltransferase NAT13 [Boletus edulis]KAF8441467.1 N-acetyltransferase NAT13 [Boletus edulis BED1]